MPVAEPMLLFLSIALAYVSGSLSGSLLLGRLVGVDIRQSGSGNAGGTNALRTRGWKFALGVVLIDIGKGILAAWVPVWLGAGTASQAWAQAACVLAAVAGHVWPVFFGFRGGKGAATLIGGLAVIWPLALPVVLAVWVVMLVATGYVGLSTIVACAALVPLAWMPIEAISPSRIAFALAAASLILYTHRSNLQRLRAGNEHRFERVRLLARSRKRRVTDSPRPED
ncbi:glycerol-3-phosphate 1-O-acyltransferase PlsY [Xanthomonadaceae bacterium JHOS43]|nr:glycerol-3-phosphate 1-O-acyltransferase PlsY [Xanthomonadaceae bacterium JHOS43]MCX7563710.1 glycerol-3-phosphate 1-O-acyltransferase PlsY [Xanthomonadaceae bacterium XH05]